MTAAATTGGPSRAAVLAGRGTGALTPARVTAGAIGLGLVASLVLLRPIRLAEAWLSTAVLSALGFGAERIGTSVVVETDGARAGFTIASGCSTALLAAPFLAVGALAVATGRIRPLRGVVMLGVALLGVVAVNQLRFGIVGAAIGWFGFRTGYGQSHVLVGTLVSTLGLVVGLAAFVLAMGRARTAEDATC